jgi:hypothetical protein
MRGYLAGAPTWIVGLVQGVLFGTLWTAATALMDQRNMLQEYLPGGLAVTVLYGVWAGFDQRRQRQRSERMLGPLSATQRRAVTRAAATGKSPEDPSLRAAAADLAYDNLERATRGRTGAIVLLVVLAVMSIAFALTDSRWYAVYSGLLVVMTIWMVRYPTILRRRVAALESSLAESPAGGSTAGRSS